MTPYVSKRVPRRMLQRAMFAASRLSRLTLLFCALATGTVIYAAQTVAIDIPADTAEAALKTLSRQSGVEVLFATEVVAGVKSKAVKGNFTPLEAANLMLANTALRVSLDSRSGALTVSTAPNAPVPRTPRLPTAEETKPKTAGAANTSGDADEVVELSPFEVSAEEDRGYQAMNTLGGTRLRTDLRDLAASISVVTKQFMEDLAADSLDVLAPYVLGAEVGGINGNFSDSFNNTTFTDFDGQRRNLTPNIRLRGLAAATRTRDYFLSDIPGDGYNVDRVEIQRGPNGMLYGLGSPSGVVNDGLMRANIQRNQTSLTTRFDRYGSYRGTLAHNQVLVKDAVAFRVAMLYNRTEYQVEDAFSTDRRAFGTVTLKPFKDTTVRVSAESALIRANPPQFRPPIDAFSYWWNAGKPVFNAATQSFAFTGTAPTGTGFNGNANQFLVNFQHRGNNPSVIIEDPNTGEYGLSIPGHPQAAELMSLRVWRNTANTGWINGDIYSTSRGDGYIRAINGGASNPNSAFWRIPQMTDPSVFDFFHHQLDGPARSRDGRWHNVNIALEQRLGRDAGIELSFDRQALDEIFRDLTQFNRYTLNLDVTTVLEDGNPNPNFGKVFMADANFSGSNSRKREAFRATAYYDLDAKRLLHESLLGKILGRHTFTGNWTTQDSEVLNFNGNEMFDLDYYAIIQSQNLGTNNVANARPAGQRQVNMVTYLSPNITTRSGPQNAGIQSLRAPVLLYDRGVKSLSLYYHPIPPAASTVPNGFFQRTFNISRAGDWSAQPIANAATHTYSKFKAASAVLQDRWFDGDLITTLGWRRDWVKTYDSGSALFDAVGAVIADETSWPLQQRLNQRHDAFNYGLVMHVPEFVRRWIPKAPEIGFLYNHSDNFQPQSARYSVFGDQIDPTKGETKEYGITFSLFDRKIDVRASYYKSASALASASDLGSAILDFDRTAFRTVAGMEGGQFSYVPANVQQAYLDFLKSPVATVFINPAVSGWYVDANNKLQGSEAGTSGRVWATTDTVAKGLEFELTANLTRNWRLSGNVARQESVRSNSGNDLWTLIQSWRPILVDTIAGDQPWNPGGTETWRTRFLQQEATTRRIRALDGSITPEVRKWRYNVITNYSFDSGRLKGWGIGGSVRWQDKAAIGYPVTTAFGTPQYDVTKPFFGPAETNYDGWVSYGRRLWGDKVRWRGQLNVRNIGQHNKMIPATAQPDGSIDAYRLAAEATWTISNSFEF